MSERGSQRWIRSQRAAAVDIADDLYVIGRDGSVRRLEGDSADLGRAVLAFFGRSRSEAELIASIEADAGPLEERAQVVHQLVDLLAQSGAIGQVTSSTDVPVAAGANLVVGVCGAIAASSAPQLVTALQRRGHTVEVVLTETATRFVAVDALAAMVQREPRTSMWPVTAHAPVPHVALAQWADLVVIYPASATTIARLATGEFSDLVAAIALTTRAPVVVVPSMNTGMLESPAVARNLEQLRADGFAIVAGVPSHEVAEAPSVRTPRAGSAPAPGEVAATIDALRAAGVLVRRAADPAATASIWDGVYRRDASLLPWASERCDADIAAALATHASPPQRLLDVGCGLGQIARHAVTRGYRVVATDVADAALALARDAARASEIVWVRDDICASSLVGPFDVIVDRASLHVLPPGRLAAWAASMRRLTSPGSTLVIKAHRDGVAGATTGWSAPRLAALLPDFDIVAEADAELPGLTGPAPIPSILVVLRRRGPR